MASDTNIRKQARAAVQTRLTPVARAFLAIAFPAVAACVALLSASPVARAADLYWTGTGATGGNGTWSNVNNWSTIVSGTNRPGSGPTSADNVYFGITNATAAATVTLTTDGTANSITQSTQTGNLTIAGNGGATDRTLTLGAGGLTVLPTAGGAFVIIGSGSATNKVNIRLDGSQIWSGTAPTGSSYIEVRNVLSRVAGDTTNRTLAFDYGNSTGQAVVLGSVQDGGSGGSLSIWNTGFVSVRLTGSSSFTGPTTLSSGRMIAQANQLPTSGTVTLRGTVSDGTGFVTGTGSVTTSKIVVEAGVNSLGVGYSGNFVAASGTANLGTISRTGGVARFNRIGTGSTAFQVGNSNNSAGILGAWALNGTSDWVTVSGGTLAVATSSTVTETGLTSVSGVYKLSAAPTLTANRSAYVISSTSGFGMTVNLGSNDLTVSGFATTSGNWTIQRSASGTGTGRLVIGSDNELVFTGASGYFISAPVVDNAAAGKITWAGFGGSSFLELSGSNSHSGGTEVGAAFARPVRLNNAYALGSGTFWINPTTETRAGLVLTNTTAAAITIATNNSQVWNGDFQFSGTSGLNMGTGTVSLGVTPGRVRTVTVNSSTFTIGGRIMDGTHADLPTTGLTKGGVGALVLSGSSSYTGPTTVSAGKLLMNGRLTSSAVTVQSGGLLGGSGTLGTVSVLAGGTFSPGNSPGLLTIGSLSLAGTTLMEIDGAGTRGVLYDAADVASGLTYGGSMLIDFGASITSALPDNTIFNLFDFATYSGTFSGITTASDGSFYAGLTFTDSGNGDKWTATKDSQTLEFTHSTGNLVIVPEPGAIALAGIGVAAAVFALRRRR